MIIKKVCNTKVFIKLTFVCLPEGSTLMRFRESEK